MVEFEELKIVGGLLEVVGGILAIVGGIRGKKNYEANVITSTVLWTKSMLLANFVANFQPRLSNHRSWAL